MVGRWSLCIDKEGLIDHILIHYDKTRVPGTFLLVVFSLNGKLRGHIRREELFGA